MGRRYFSSTIAPATGGIHSMISAWVAIQASTCGKFRAIMARVRARIWSRRLGSIATVANRSESRFGVSVV